MNTGRAAKITYAQDTDPWLKRAFINAIEVMSGRRHLTSIYDDLCSEPFEIPRFFTRGLDLAGVEVLCNCDKKGDKNGKHEWEARIPRQGPVVFIANHPFGIVDGMILCELASRTRGDFRILINHRLCQDENLNKLFLPISFEATREATRLNIETKRAAERLLKEGGTLIIFPGGGVATRTRLGFGELEELPWTTFAAKLIKSARATVVPVYFHGENSFFFHFVSNLSMDLRLAFFIREVTRCLNTSFQLTLGEPIAWEEMSGYQHRQALTDFLQRRVEALASAPLDEAPESGIARNRNKGGT